MKSNYIKLLKKGRWKNRRAKIIRRDGGVCAKCGSKTRLCVHHLYYYKNPIEPWLYPDDCLITWCEVCHNKWHKENENIIKKNPIGGINEEKIQKKPRKPRRPRKLRTISKG